MVAIIPNPANIKTRQYSTEQGVYTPDTSYAGQRTAALGKGVEALYQKQLKSEVAKAGVDYQVMKAQQDTMYEDDDDEDSIEDRYHAGVMEGLGKAAEGITDGEVRAAFVQEQLPSIEVGRLQMRALAHKKRGDKQVAYLSNATTAIIQGAMGGGDMSQASLAIERMWRSLAEQGHVSQKDAERNIMAAKHDMAIGRLKTLSAQEQIDALKEPWARELDPGTRAQLKDAAQEQLRLGQAQEAAHDVQELDRSAAEKALWKKYKNKPELYRDAMSQYDGLHQNDLYADAELQGELHNKYHLGVSDGSLPVAKIISDHPQDWAKMRPAQRDNLKAIEAQRATGASRVDSDRNVLHRLNWLIKNKNYTEAYNYFTENSAKLNQADFKQFSGVTIDGVIADEIKPLFEAQKMLDGLTVRWHEDDKIKLYMGLSEWYFDYQKRAGEIPPADLTSKHIEQSLLSHKTGQFFGFALTETPFGMTRKEQISAYVNYDSEEERAEFISNYPIAVQEEIMKGVVERGHKIDKKGVMMKRGETLIESRLQLQAEDPELYEDVLESFPVGTEISLELMKARFYKLQELRYGS